MTTLFDPREFVTAVDLWLDGAVAPIYQEQYLAQDWARVAKVVEEAGEAIEALIAVTGQNPRKPQRPEAREDLLNELADTAMTAIFAIQHFTKDADQTMDRVWSKLRTIHDRMHKVSRAA